jgi:pimeloyl-ACP methyl ester carboxylesterase
MTSQGSGTSPSDMTITEHELAQCEQANATGRPPVVFVHGLWLLPSSWDRWATLFEDNGYAALTPGWPDDPAPFRGVLPLPISSLKSAFPVLGNPANRNRAVPLTYEQFRYGFANAVSEEEAKQLYETYAVPTSGVPLFQAATANLNPWTEAKVDTRNPERGPLLIISGEKDHTVPWAIASASYKQQQDNPGVTEIVEIKDRGHALTIDSGWRKVADTALGFVKRFI